MKLTIESKKVEIEPGATILQAAEKAGVYVPTLCHDKRLKAYGSCRMCLVEVAGSRKLLTACSTPAADGMVVSVNTERLNEIRRRLLELLLVHHPLDCPVCDASGACRLQDMTFEYGVTSGDFSDKRKDIPVVTNSPMIERNMGRCIFCGKCVRVCDEVKGVRAIGYSGRGFEGSVGTAFGVPMDCEFCGNCVASCPVGALTSKPFKNKARPFFLSEETSVCSYCGTGCRLKLDYSDPEQHSFLQGKLWRTRPDDQDELTAGSFCGRGAFGYEYVHSADRLRSPYVKRGRKQEQSDWPRALDAAADGLREVASRYGSAAVAGIISSQATNEESYLLSKLMRVGLGSGMICAPAGLGELAWREAAFEILAGLPTAAAGEITAADLLLTVESDLSESHPVLGIRVLQAARYGGARLIYASARETKLSHYAASDLRIKPGSGAVLMAYLGRCLLEKVKRRGGLKGLLGLGEFTSSVRKLTAGKTARATGISVGELTDLADQLDAAKKPLLLISHLAHETQKGSDYARAAANLAYLLARLKGCDPPVVFASEFSNSRGVLDMGGDRSLYPGGNLEEVEKIWDVKVPGATGLAAAELLEKIEAGQIKALYIAGLDPATQLLGGARWGKALRKLDFLVVQDIFATEASRAAAVVLPGVSWAEKEGSYTNFSGRVGTFKPVVKPLGLARTEWQVMMGLMERFGVAANYPDLAALRCEIEKLLPGYFSGKTRNNKPGGTLMPFVTKGLVEKPGGKYRFLMLSGNSLFQLGSYSGHSAALSERMPRPVVEMSGRDAVRLKLANDDLVEVVSRRGKLRGKLKVVEGNISGVVYVPAYVPGAAAAALLPAPDSKGRAVGCAVAVRKVR